MIRKKNDRKTFNHLDFLELSSDRESSLIQKEEKIFDLIAQFVEVFAFL
jgi:hypothetical protein